MTTITGAAAVVECLKQEKVKYVFSLPGTTVLDVYDVLYDTPEIQLIITRHEQVAAFMADGYARACGEPGVCLVSRGPGAANIAIGLHNAYEESSSVVAIVGHINSKFTYRECFEDMDLSTFFRPVSKWTVEINSAERVPELLQRAIRTAVTSRSRPVVISLSQDMQRETIADFTPQPYFRVRPYCCGEEEIINAARILAEAKMPVIFLGGGSARSGSTSAIVRLAEMLGAPVITTWRRSDVFPNSHPLFLGSTGPGVFDTTLEYLGKADVVLAIGNRFSEFSTHRYKVLSPHCRLIQIDSDPYEIGKIFVPTVGIVSDAASAVKMLLEVLGKENITKDISFKSEVQEYLERFRGECQLPMKEDDQETVFSGNVVRVLQEVLPKYSLLVMDAATFEPWMTRYYGFSGPGTLISPAGGCLGFGFPAAMGAKLALPHRPVVCIVGDGGYSMVSQDLETAVRYKIPVIVLVTNNFAYGNIRDRQNAEYNGRQFGCKYGNPDFAAQARLVGAVGERITSSKQLASALRSALSATGPVVLDVILGSDAGLPEGVTPPPTK